ncbi:MAG: SpoIID/LytB domain-containing protein [Oscillospiraceae bacterium]
MKLRSILSGITALLLVGVFYTFAFCMVEDVDENAISMEYYYSTETEPADDDKSDGESAEAPAEIADLNNAEFPMAEPDHALPAEMSEDKTAETTVVPDEAEEKDETVSAAPKAENLQEDNVNEDYPEDFEIDEYDENSSEAKEQSVLAGDSKEDMTLSVDDEEIEIEETTAPETEVSFETIPAETEKETESTLQIAEDVPEVSGDIIITVWGESETSPTETSVSVSIGNGVDISTEETFTARFNGAVQTVNAYDLICGIVNNEISSSFSDEAIKAQAVAAYSYVKYHNVNGLTPTVLVKQNPPERIKKLVSEVWGVCCYYNGSVAQTVYMASSSGYTADAVNVWGGSVPYLKSVFCPFDAESDPNYGSRMKVSEDNMRLLLEGALGITLSGNPQNWIVVTDYVDGNYVSKINIDGQKTISGRKMRETVMGYKLKSAAFDVSYSNGYFVFTTYGYGHGVGMSQNGANILAKQGYSYEEILKFYFTGIEVL